MNSDCVLAQAFFSFCLQYFFTRWLVSVSFAMHRGAAGRAGAAWGCSRCLVSSAWRGELRGMCCMAEHGMLITAVESTCWVCADGPVITQEGQHWPLLPLGTDWSTILLSCFFAFFFLPDGFIFFHVSTFHLSPWACNDYHLNNYTLVCFYSSYLAGL